MSWGSFWHSVGGGISKAFGVITSPIRWAGGIIKDSVHAVTHLPAQIVQGVTKIAGKVNDTFKNVVNHVADDVKDLAMPALRHRIVVSPELEVEGVTTDDVLGQILAHVEAPRQ